MHFVMPLVWPSTYKSTNASGRDMIRVGLDSMSNSPQFMPLVCALLSEHSWLTPEFREHFKVICNFDAAVLQAKRLLHFVYDITNGNILKWRIACALSAARNFSANSDGLFDFEHFAGSEIHSSISEMPSVKSITCSQALLAFHAEKFFACEYDSTGLAAAAQVAHAGEKTDVEFFDTTSYNVDAFGRLLRVAVITVCAIQRLHIEVLKTQKTMKHSMVPKFTRSFTSKKKKLKASDHEELWRNYIFDIAASWMVIQRLYIACRNESSNEMMHGLHKARIWSFTTGIAGSSKQLMALEKNPLLQKISTIGVFLHEVLLRLWPIGLYALNTKGHGSTAAVKRAIGRISASVFVRSDEDSKTDMAECGTSTILDNHWTYTMLQNSQLGITDGHFGSRVEDLNHSVYAGALSDAITKTTSHLWAASVSHQVWAPLSAGLPELSEINERFWPALGGMDFTLEDLETQGHAFRRTFLKNRIEEENEEIDTIVSSLDVN